MHLPLPQSGTFIGSRDQEAWALSKDLPCSLSTPFKLHSLGTGTRGLHFMIDNGETTFSPLPLSSHFSSFPMALTLS